MRFTRKKISLILSIIGHVGKGEKRGKRGGRIPVTASVGFNIAKRKVVLRGSHGGGKRGKEGERED